MLTMRQRHVLDFILAFDQKFNHAPSYVEIAVGLGLSPMSKATIHRHIHQLVKRGYVRQLPGQTRAIEVIRIDSRITEKPEDHSPSHERFVS